MVGTTKTKDIVRVSDAALRVFVGYNVKRTMNAIRSDLKTALEPLGLRMITYSALTLIGENPSLSQAQLASALSVERPNLVAVVEELVERGLVSRDRVPTDRRTYALRLTAQGACLLAQATDSVNVHEDRVLAGVTAQDHAALIRILAKIEKNGTERS